MTPDRDSLLAAIAALETQRGVLGDAVTELALAPLRELLAKADGAAPPEPAPTPQLRRAQVTVLFADIVDSTALASRLDAEDVLQIFGGVLQRAADCVRARGGRVLRYTGDGLKAGFGTQGTREDDAANAVLAGLDILAAARQHAEQVARDHGVQGFALRVGAHTGEVALGAGFEADNTLTGDTVNIAARMEQAAPPGGLRISAETWAHVRGQFDGQPQPPLVVKGMAEPMATWLVQSVRAGGVERGIAGLAVPMVGRDAERSGLHRALQASAQGPLQAVTVLADAGVGKTRLLREVLADAVAEGAQVLVVRAHPGAELRPWGLLHGLVSAHCAISDSDSAELARSKLLAGLAPQLGADPQASAQRIGQLLGLDFGDVPALSGLDARALRDLAFADLIRWLAGVCHAAAGHAVVLVFEDLHWADEASLDALAHWMDQAAHLPLALLMSTRPALLERRAAWGSAGPGSRLLQLDALSDAHSGTLADALLQRIDGTPEALRSLLIQRAEGNPFYMEELLRRLLDDGAIRRDGARWQVDGDRLTALRLPTTLVGLLQARLDALPPAERRGVQHASIVGHVFWDDALVQVDPAATAALDALQRRQWVRQRAASAFDGTPERQFHHHLLHQVTYDTVLKEDRRRGHAAVAHWLAERTAGRAPEFLAITGEHAERAGETALAADCYDRAASEARKRFANVLAVECLRKALRLLPDDAAAPRLRLLDRLAAVLDGLGDRPAQQQVLDERRTLLAAHPNPLAQADLVLDQAMLCDRTGDYEQAHALALEAAALATPIGAWSIASLAHSELCWLAHQQDRPDAAQAHLQAARDLAARARATEPLREVQVLQLAGILAGEAGQQREGIEMLEQAYALAEACGERRAQLASLDNIAMLRMFMFDHARALEVSERALVLARAIGDRRMEAFAQGQRSWALWESGRLQEAVAQARTAMEILRALRDPQGQAGHLMNLGAALSAQGEAEAAWQAFDEAHRLWATLLPGSSTAFSALALRAEQDLALGRHPAAREAVEQVLAVMLPDASGLVSSQYNLTSRLACGQVLRALDDARAAAVLGLLQRDARARVQAQADQGLDVLATLHPQHFLHRCLQDGPGPAA
ncbi:MAG: AAA family ATPase [Rubrivivax sp.]|nr:AAA family ATPase [Rubrivivax sp.]